MKLEDVVSVHGALEDFDLELASINNLDIASGTFLVFNNDKDEFQFTVVWNSDLKEWYVHQ